jgi:hypothetical protein
MASFCAFSAWDFVLVSRGMRLGLLRRARQALVLVAPGGQPGQRLAHVLGMPCGIAARLGGDEHAVPRSQHAVAVGAQLEAFASRSLRPALSSMRVMCPRLSWLCWWSLLSCTWILPAVSSSTMWLLRPAALLPPSSVSSRLLKARQGRLPRQRPRRQVVLVAAAPGADRQIRIASEGNRR